LSQKFLARIKEQDTMKACKLLKSLRKTLHSEKFQNKHKINPTDFSRKPVLSFPILFTFILKGIKNSLQTDLFNLTDTAFLSADVSKQAFSDARKKLSASAFNELNDQLIYKYYKKNKELIKWKGYIVLVADGSTIQLPNHIETKKKYGCSTNQSEEEVPLARSVHVYDPLNKITICGNLNSYNSGERDGLYELINKIVTIKQKCGHKKVLLILDRHYPCYTLIQLLTYYKIDFVMRCKQDFSTEIKRIVKDNVKDSITFELWKNFTLKQEDELKKFNIDHKKIPIRVVLVDLPESEDEKCEVLLTSLINDKVFKYDCFKELYSFRWGIEENIKFFKLKIEIENFSGMTPHSIEQEFYATILVSNIRALLANEAQELLNEDVLNKKHKYIINKNISISALKLALIEVLVNPKSNIDEFCIKIKKRMIKASVAKMPGRKYPRVRRRTRRKFHNHQRRAAG
jgi:hypothetical protein